MNMPTIEQIVSRYLFNKDAPPTNLKDEDLIRSAGAVGDTVSELLNIPNSLTGISCP